MNGQFLQFAQSSLNNKVRFSSRYLPQQFQQDLSTPVTSNTSSQLLSLINNSSSSNLRALSPSYHYMAANGLSQKSTVSKPNNKELTKVPLKESNRQLVPRISSKSQENDKKNKPKVTQLKLKLFEKLNEQNIPIKQVETSATSQSQTVIHSIKAKAQNQIDNQQNKVLQPKNKQIVTQFTSQRNSQEDINMNKLANSKIYLSSKDFSKLGSSYFGESEGSFQQAKGTSQNSPARFLSSPIPSPINNCQNTPGKPPLMKNIFKKNNNFEINQQQPEQNDDVHKEFIHRVENSQDENQLNLDNDQQQQQMQSLNYKENDAEKSPIKEQQNTEEQIKKQIQKDDDEEEINEQEINTLMDHQENALQKIKRKFILPISFENLQRDLQRVQILETSDKNQIEIKPSNLIKNKSPSFEEDEFQADAYQEMDHYLKQTIYEDCEEIKEELDEGTSRNQVNDKIPTLDLQPKVIEPKQQPPDQYYSQEQQKELFITSSNKNSNKHQQLGFFNFQIQIISPFSISPPQKMKKPKRKKIRRSLQRHYSQQKRNQERTLARLYEQKSTELRLQKLESLILRSRSQQYASCDLLGLNGDEQYSTQKEQFEAQIEYFGQNIQPFMSQGKQNLLNPSIDDSQVQPLIENHFHKKSQFGASMHEELTNMHTRKASSMYSKDQPKFIDIQFLNKEIIKEQCMVNQLSEETQCKSKSKSIHINSQRQPSKYSIINESHSKVQNPLSSKKGKQISANSSKNTMKSISKVGSKSKLTESQNDMSKYKRGFESKNSTTLTTREPETKKKVYENTIALVQKKLQQLKRNN